jgi:2-haloacid dehalogenase
LRYRALLLDLDHTLFDSDACEARAFDHALADAGVADPARHRPAYQAINRALWDRVERGELTAGELRARRFAELVAATGIAAAPDALADAFAAGMGAFGELYPGVREVLDALAGLPGVALALVTNGLSEVQRARIARLGLAGYFEVIAISSELGVAKPAPAIFAHVLTALGAARADAVVVGDSLSSDIQGGRNAGIATCWYNPAGRAGGEGLVDHEIARLDELLALVGA